MTNEQRYKEIVRHAGANRWMNIALESLLTTEYLVTFDKRFLNQSMFWAQQCASQSFKAFLCYQKQPFERTDDLVILVNLCQALDIRFTKIAQAAIAMNPYQTLYPGDDSVIPDLATLSISVKQARMTYNFVVEIINEEK